MSITVLNYLDQELVNQITQQAAMRNTTASSPAENADFAASLTESSKMLGADNDNTNSQTNTTTASDTTVSSPEDYEAYFKEASEAYGVSTTILKSIAKAESNFNPSAVSSAGAVGIMQLMPATAASLGVSNSYDARENIMGGAKYISQLLSRYQGNISLALAAYNAGCGNVDKYGGIPPFTETQNYVKKVLSYMNGTFSTSDTSTSTSSSDTSGIFGLTGEERDAANEMLGNFFASNNITKSTLDLLVALLKLKNILSSDTTGTTSGSSTDTTSTDTVTNSSVYPSSFTASPVLPGETTSSITDTAIPAPSIPSVDPVTPAEDTSDNTSVTADAAASTEETDISNDISSTGEAVAPTEETATADTSVTPESSTGEPVAAPSID